MLPFLLAQFAAIPSISPNGAFSLLIYGAVIVFFLDKAVSIGVNLRRGKEDQMPKGQLISELARIEKKVDEVHAERRSTSKEMFDKQEQLAHSIAASFSDFSRALGRLEGGQELATSIRDALKNCAAHQRQ